jgi:hypothetical protein
LRKIMVWVRSRLACIARRFPFFYLLAGASYQRNPNPNAAPAAAGTALLAGGRRRTPGWKAIAAGTAVSLSLAFIEPRVRAEFRRKQHAELISARAAAPQVPAIASAAPYTSSFFQRGMTLTAEWPAGYASEKAQETLRMLPGYGVNAVALVPYGSIRRPGRFGGGMESDEGMELLSRVAHSIGIKIMLKPQLWGRIWPADFDLQNEPERRVWFDQYAAFLEHYAQLATRIHADLFCVGTELAHMSRYEAEWRRMIARVRKTYRGPLTYAAIQGPEFETLRFWDALDYIGLSNYYPLPDTLDATEIVGKVAAVQRAFKKPVIFAEAGFSSFAAPHRAPWDETPRRLAPEEQARCYEAIFRSFYKMSWFQGMYWWKMGTDRRGGLGDGSHTPWGKPAMDVVRRWYTQGGR